ncbi:MAG: glycosyltransferase family 2 protein [Planctomycetota bacterium]|jgi:glycosyltransferase involved in cell wall biosynthesis
MDAPLVSIVIPHYQTEELARLCLRSIRRRTAEPSCEVIVVDNGSRDGRSLDYLRRVGWIRLIERTGELPSRVFMIHKQSLDIGFEAARGRYLLSMHTDTIVLCDDWLRWLVNQLESSDDLAAVGSYKLSRESGLQRAVKAVETGGRRLLRRAVQDTTPFIRSHCALYRRSALDALGYRFADDEQTCGRKIHFDLLEAGYGVRLLDSDAMNRRLVHLDHATMVLHPELGTRRRTVVKGRRRIERFLAAPDIRAILADASLDGAPASAATPAPDVAASP